MTVLRTPNKLRPCVSCKRGKQGCRPSEKPGICHRCFRRGKACQQVGSPQQHPDLSPIAKPVEMQGTQLDGSYDQIPVSLLPKETPQDWNHHQTKAPVETNSSPIGGVGLPDKLLRNIFEFLPRTDQHNLSRTNRQWKEVLTSVLDLSERYEPMVNYKLSWKPQPIDDSLSYFRPNNSFAPQAMRIHHVFGSTFSCMHVSKKDNAIWALRTDTNRFIRLSEQHSFWYHPFCLPLQGSVEMQFDTDHRVFIRNYGIPVKVGDILSAALGACDEYYYLRWNSNMSCKHFQSDLYRNVRLVFT